MNKPPAFQFYAADYLSDENVTVMSLDDEGAYMRLLAYCWIEGSIPADIEQLKMLTKGGSTNLQRVVERCFKRHPVDSARLVHPRLELERQKQIEWREKSKRGGLKSSAAKKTEDNNGAKGGSRVVEGLFNTPSPSPIPNIDREKAPPNLNADSTIPTLAEYQELGFKIEPKLPKWRLEDDWLLCQERKWERVNDVAARIRRVLQWWKNEGCPAERIKKQPQALSNQPSKPKPRGWILDASPDAIR